MAQLKSFGLRWLLFCDPGRRRWNIGAGWGKIQNGESYTYSFNHNEANSMPSSVLGFELESSPPCLVTYYKGWMMHKHLWIWNRIYVNNKQLKSQKETVTHFNYSCLEIPLRQEELAGCGRGGSRVRHDLVAKPPQSSERIPWGERLRGKGKTWWGFEGVSRVGFPRMG